MSYNLTPEELNEMRNWYPKAEQLVRLGMLPVNQLPYIKRALVGIESDAYLPLIIRRPFYRFIDQVMELALGEPGIYRLIRNKVAENRNDSITNRYMPEETTMDNEETLTEGNAENKAKKREFDKTIAKNVAARRGYFQRAMPGNRGGFESDVQAGRKVRKMVRSTALAKIAKGEEWVDRLKEERDADERAGDREERKLRRDKAAYDKAAVDKAIAASRQKIGKKEGSAIHRLLKGRHESVEHGGTEEIAEGLFDTIRAKNIKLADIGKNRPPMPKPEPGRVKRGTRDGKTPTWVLSQDGSIKRQNNEELELLNLNLLDEDVDYRKTPEGMLQTLSNMVKIKKRHRGKVSVNDRKIASKARNELRRRKYYNSAHATIASSFDTAYLDLADLLAEQEVFLTDLQLDALENELTEEVLMELSPELKMRYAKKVEKNVKDRGIYASGTKAVNKILKRVKTADKILKTEGVEVVNEISAKMAGSYIKKAVNSKSDADFSLGMHHDKQNENQHYRAVGDKGSYMASVNQLLRKTEKRSKGISMATDKLTKESYAGEEDYPAGEETYTTEKPKKKIRPSKSTWYKDVDDAADVKGVDPKMKVKFAKEDFDKRFAQTLDLFEVKHISELDADMTKLFMSLVQSESKSDLEYQERVYDKIRSAKKDDSKLTPEQIRYRAEKQAKAAKTQAALDAAKKELATTKVGSGWSKVRSDVE